MDQDAQGSAAIEGEVIERVPEDYSARELGRTDRRGRPPEMTEAVVSKLVKAFDNGFNISEACIYAGISRPMYYDWLGKDDRFSYRMSEAQGSVMRRAKRTVAQAIKAGDVGTARWYLNARDPDFSAKANLTPPEGLQATEAKLKEFMDDTDDGAYPSLPAEAGDTTGSTPDDGGQQPPTTAGEAGGDEVAPSPSDIS